MVKALSCVWLFATLWTIAQQAPLSMGFFKQEYWHRLPFPSPGDLPNPGLKLTSPVSPALELDSLPDEPSWKPIFHFAKSLQSCPTVCDPIDGTHQAPPSLGFSKQEHWSGLPFPPPMHESEK